jgi:hypothetical protein
MGDGSELVEVAFVANRYEAAIVQALLEESDIPSVEQQVGVDGPMLGYGYLTGAGSRRVMVHAKQVEEARRLLAEARAEDEQAAPEPVNAKYLDEAHGRGPRNYGVVGAYVRMYLVMILAMIGFALAFGAFMLLRAA